MERQTKQVDRVFEDVRTNKLNQEDIESFIRQFDSEFEDYCQQKEDQLRQSVESITDNMVELVQQWKQKQCQQNTNRQIMVIVNRIKDSYEQVVTQQEQTIRYHVRLLYMKYYLKQSQNKVDIIDFSKLDDYKKEIEEYQEQNQQYQIWANFCSDCSMISIDNRMSVVRMIDRLNANKNVGVVWIRLDSSMEWNNEILRMMVDKFTNIYHINVWDWNDNIDDGVHNMIKQWVQQQPIIGFVLLFYRSLYTSKYGYELIKQYNQLIRHKQYLEVLSYIHSRIGGRKKANTKQQIEQLILKVDKL